MLQFILFGNGFPKISHQNIVADPLKHLSSHFIQRPINIHDSHRFFQKAAGMFLNTFFQGSRGHNPAHHNNFNRLPHSLPDLFDQICAAVRKQDTINESEMHDLIQNN